MFAHPARDMSGHYVAVFKFDLEEGIGQGFKHRAFHFDYVFFYHELSCRVQVAVLCHRRACYERVKCKLAVIPVNFYTYWQRLLLAVAPVLPPQSCMTVIMLVDTTAYMLKIRHLKAGIAQLVEHNLAKVGVASSSLVSRSKYN